MNRLQKKFGGEKAKRRSGSRAIQIESQDEGGSLDDFIVEDDLY